MESHAIRRIAVFVWRNSIFVVEQTPTERERKHICDFSRCGLNARLVARIQTLLRGHKYAFFLFQRADFGWGQNYYLRVKGFGVSIRCLLLILRPYQQLSTYRNKLSFVCLLSNRTN